MNKKRSHRVTTQSTVGGWDHMLNAVLLQNKAARIADESNDGSLALSIPTKATRFLFPPFSWLIRPPKERVTVLDPIGAELWRKCDGRRTVEDLVVDFAIKHRLSFHEGRVSVTHYVKTLLQRGALAVSLASE